MDVSGHLTNRWSGRVRDKVPSSSVGAPLSSNVRQHMKSRALALVFGIITLAIDVPAAAEDGLCKSLKSFITSVKPDETHVLKFHTSWGSNFRDDDEPAFSAKRCNHGGYDPAKAVCDYLMEHGATEFSGNNAKSAISCLSTQTHVAAGMQIHSVSVSFSIGTEDRGSLVDIEFVEDTDLGGMVLSITADGY